MVVVRNRPSTVPTPVMLWEGQKLVQEARAGLRALGDEAAGLAEKMEDGRLLGFSIEQEAVFLAGLAIGLELGRG